MKIYFFGCLVAFVINLYSIIRDEVKFTDSETTKRRHDIEASYYIGMTLLSWLFVALAIVGLFYSKKIMKWFNGEDDNQPPTGLT